MDKLKDHTVKLNTDEKVIPLAQQQSRIPFQARDKVKDTIAKLEKEGIIERVPENQPTPLVSPEVDVPKSDGKVRLRGYENGKSSHSESTSFNPHSGGY